MKHILYAIAYFSTLFSFSQVNFESSNLPILILNTNGQTIPDEPKLNASMKLIDNGPGQRNHINDQIYNYNGFIGIELRGNSSQNFDQKQYGIETRDSVGNNLNVSLLGMPKENDWVLNAPWNDISMIRNVTAYHIWDKMDHWGPRTKLCEVVLNGKYQGIYILTESIKRDKNRVSTAKLTSQDITGTDITGGYIMKIDASNSNNDKSFVSKVPGEGTGGGKNVTWLYHYPDPKDIHPLQEEYIRKYIDTVETLIQSDKYDDPVNGYAKYLSLPSFIDYFIHGELSLNSDGFKRSAYFYKEKQDLDGTKGKLKAGTVWDYNLAFGNCNFCKGNQPTSWAHEGCETLPTPALWKRLYEDKNFQNAVKCRYTELRTSLLHNDSISDYLDAYADTLSEAQARHFQQWDALLQKNNGNIGGGGWGSPLWFSAYRVASHSQEITIMKQWFMDRLQFLDDNLKGECLITSQKESGNHFQKIFIFPNPTADVVVVELDLEINKIEILSSEGKVLFVKDNISTSRIVLDEFKNLIPGLYTIKLHTVREGILSKKVQKN